MFQDPWSHTRQYASWKPATDDLSGQRDPRPIAGVADVAMRGWVVFEIHVDDDPGEFADPRHRLSVPRKVIHVGDMSA